MKIKHNSRIQHALDKLEDASHLYNSARMIEIEYRSLDEKDKLIDELIIRKLRRIADDLMNECFKELMIQGENKDEAARNAEGSKQLTKLLGELKG